MDIKRTSYKPKKNSFQNYRRPEPKLTKKQVDWLVKEALCAYNIVKGHGAHDGLSFDNWRKEQLAEEFTTCSFRELMYREFERAINVYRRINGKPLFPNPQSILETDIPARKKYINLLKNAINELRKTPTYKSKAGEKNKVAAYMATLLKNRFRVDPGGDDPESVELAVSQLKAVEIHQFAITLNNRIADLKKEGDPLDRNKKQRESSVPHRKRNTENDHE